MRRALVMLASVSLSMAALPGSADIIKLRTAGGCATESGLCLESLDDVLAEIHDPSGSRQLPGPSNPVVVEIGPGTHDLTSTDYAFCSGLSDLAFRGAGKIATRITGGGYVPSGLASILGPYVVSIEDCSNIEFQDLTIVNEPGTSNGGVVFAGDGGSQWSNVRIATDAGASAGWYDDGASAPANSVHYWFSSEIDVRQTGASSTALWAQGSSHRIYGSKFIVKIAAGAGNEYGTLGLAGPFDVRVHGSRIAALSSVGNKPTHAIRTIGAAAIFYGSCGAARLTVEGSEVEAINTGTGTGTSVAIGDFCEAGSTVRIQVQGTLFDVVGPVRKRVVQGGAGRVQAPVDHGAGANPPGLGTVWAPKALDGFRETDCSTTLCGDSSLGQAVHQLAYDSTCTTAGPWYDVTTQKCRGL